MRRYVDTFFQHPVLFLLPAVLLLAAAVIAARRAVQDTRPYTSEATIAVNLDPTRPRALGELPLSEQHASLLGELMGTDSFVLGALKRTRAADRLTGGADDDLLAHEVRSQWSQHAAGPNTVVVQYRCDLPEFCAEMVAAVLASYRDEVLAGRVAGPRATAQFYDQQVQAAEQRFRSLPAADPARDSARENYQDLLVKLADARLEEALAEREAQAAFRVIAPPRAPDAAESRLRAARLPLMLGGVMALLIFASAVVLTTWMDTSVRTPEDVLEATGLKAAAVVPRSRRYRHDRAAAALMPGAVHGPLWQRLPWVRRINARTVRAGGNAGD